MNQRDLENLSRFSAVWERVQNRQTPQEQPELRLSEAVMDALQELSDGYCAMARRADGTHRNRLMCLARRVERVSRDLQFRYFLETGDIYCTRKTEKFASYNAYNLRKLWQSTLKNSENLQFSHLKGEGTFVAEFAAAERELDFQNRALEALMKEFFV